MNAIYVWPGIEGARYGMREEFPLRAVYMGMSVAPRS